MLIYELKNFLEQCDENMEIFVAFGEDDGEDFTIETSSIGNIYLVSKGE